MSTNKDDVDVPDYDADVNEFAQTQRAAQQNKESESTSSSESPRSGKGSSSRSRKGSSSRSRKGSSSRSRKDQEQDDTDSEENETKREPFTATLERGLRSRMNGMVHHAQMVGEPRNVASISDYVNMALSEKLARDEKRLNNGKRYPEPVHMRTGRPQKRQ